MTLVPAVRRFLRALVPLLPLVLALAVAACGGELTTGPASPVGSATPVASGAGPSAAPTPVSSGEEPSATGEPAGSPGATPTPGATDGSGATATPAPTGGTAAACTGSDKNRAFFAGVAGAVTWDVYCPVLPAGWFVDMGSFRLAGGGKLDISYKGPGGARLEIRQGAFCADLDPCIPPATDAGAASFGDLPARLLDAGGGDWLVVAEGGDVDWDVRSIGLDRVTAVTYAAAFVRVGR